jgi:hypothetical protein
MEVFTLTLVGHVSHVGHVEAFVKITMMFKDIFRKMEVSI